MIAILWPIDRNLTRSLPPRGRTVYRRRMSEGREFSMLVVGGAYPNADGSNRMFEVAMCRPGEPVTLKPEPRNPHDPLAIAVLSSRNIQIGYIRAEQCGWLGGKIRQGIPVEAIFQEPLHAAAAIRVRIGGGAPSLPPARESTEHEEEVDFWVD